MDTKAVLIYDGAPDLIRAIALALVDAGARVALAHTTQPEASAQLATELLGQGSDVVDVSQLHAGDTPRQLDHVHRELGGLRAVVNLMVPTMATSADDLFDYPRRLGPRIDQACSFMAEHDLSGIVINQFMLATMFAGHPLAPAAAASRGGVAGLTRTYCVRYGKAGVRVVGLFVGLLDVPEVKAMASQKVLKANTPRGHWISAGDVAGTVSFLALDSGYITGQMLVLDGGMTSGINGI